MVHGSP
jgi:hypothetical protein